MCRLSNMYVVDLFDSDGIIQWNVANACPKLMNNPCKIIVKQITSELKDGVDDISDEFNLRVIHNMNIQSGSNSGSSNSNVLAFIDNFQVRNYTGSSLIGFTTTECKLFAPSGLPAILILQRESSAGIRNIATLSWAIRLEITVNPDED